MTTLDDHDEIIGRAKTVLTEIRDDTVRMVTANMDAREKSMIIAYAISARAAGMKARHYKIECEGFDSLPTFATKAMADHFVASMTDQFECAFTIVKSKKG